MFGFKRVWCVDTEFGTRPDGRPDPRCLVAVELYSRKEIRLWEDELTKLSALPFDVANDLFVAYSAQAEISVLLELGLPIPRHILDLFFEFRAIRNGRRPRKDPGSKLIHALAHYGLHHIPADEKDDIKPE